MCLEGELQGQVQGREGVLLGVTPGGSGGGTLGMHVAALLVQVTAFTVDFPVPNALQISLL